MAPLPEAETIDPAALLEAFRKGELDLICVLGPTASGKTRYAVQLARTLNWLLQTDGAPSGAFARTEPPQKLEISGDPGWSRSDAEDGAPSVCKGAEILSADSRQVYRGMDIGTGKDLSEYEEIPYHLIDIVPAGSRFDIYQYQAAFAQVYADVRSRGAIPILCGGSGLYIEAVTRAYRFDKENGVDPSRLPQRVYYIGTLVSREERVARIDRRLEARLREGLVDEIRTLLQTVPAEELIRYGLEYKFVTQYVLGQISREDMEIGLGNAIHQFAKRQMTWFRGMERDGIRIHWTRP